MKNKNTFIDAKDIVAGDKIFTVEHGVILIEKVEVQKKKANPIKITFNKNSWMAFKPNDKVEKI